MAFKLKWKNLSKNEQPHIHELSTLFLSGFGHQGFHRVIITAIYAMSQPKHQIQFSGLCIFIRTVIYLKCFYFPYHDCQIYEDKYLCRKKGIYSLNDKPSEIWCLCSLPYQTKTNSRLTKECLNKLHCIQFL